MPNVGDLSRRLLLGRKLASDRLSQTLLPKRLALPAFSSDALSSVAYAPDEILLTLAAAGLAAYSLSWEVGAAVAVVMLVVVAAYRQNVHAYPSGGGDYEVASVNLGPSAGLTVGGALLVDYVLTVAVSISSAAQYAAAAIPALRGYEVVAAAGAVVLLAAVNLRGVRESGLTFAAPTYLFMVAILGMAAWGWVRYALGDLPPAPSAGLGILPEGRFANGLTGLGLAFVVLRAFSSGCVALTGVETISNGVPAFRKPKSRNAATTLLMLGLIAVTMLMSVVVLAELTGVRFAENPAEQLVRDGVPVGEDYDQDPVIGQLARSVFDGFPPAFLLVATATGVILVLAANTAFNGFPVLGSILARDGLLPRQLHTRGDRLAFSNGILTLAAAAVALIVVMDAEVTRLIQVYLVGVFVSFVLGQAGMVRHWNRLLASPLLRREERRTMGRSRAINAAGLAVTTLVLVVVVVTKFARGAWIAVVAIAALYVLMRAVRGHYAAVGRELEQVGGVDASLLPSRVHAIVLVSKLHKPTLRAVAYARASHPDAIEAITVNVDLEDTHALTDEWDRRNIPVPLKVLDSPYREVTRPVLDYVQGIRRASPRDVVNVYVPEYVVGHWWERVLHNQSAMRLKARLLFTPGTMVTSVPWQLRSAGAGGAPGEPPQAGDVRRGEVRRPTGPGGRERKRR